MVPQNTASCIIWPMFPDRAVETDSSGQMTTVYGSNRAGGDYKLTPFVTSRLTDTHRPVDLRTRARLTTTLISLRELGVSCPEVTLDLLSTAEQANDIPVHIRANRLLLHLDWLTQSIGQAIGTTPHDTWYPAMLAFAELTQESEIAFLEDYLRKQGWLEGQPGAPIVSVEGYSRLARLRSGRDSDQVFVAMWFSPKMEQVYAEAIEPAIRDARYNPQRVGQGQTTDRIDDEAEAKIRASRLVVADLTHDPAKGVRGSVYYEAGFARALGKPIIYTAEKGSDVHFNLDHLLRIEWADTEDLRTRLTHRITNLPELQR